MSTNWFRKNKRKLLGILVVFLMVIWGLGPAVDMLVPKPPVGEIAGKTVTQEEFNDAVVRWARVFFRNTNQPVAELVWKQMALINQAKAMGIYVTNEELAQEIQSFFPIDQRIFSDREAYRRMLGSTFQMTEYHFEKTIEEYLLSQKLRYLLRGSVKVTNDEALQRYMKENETVKIKYAVFKARDFIESVEVSEDEVKSFYDKYSTSFPNAEEGIWGYKEHEKVKLEYILASNDEIDKQIEIADEEMKVYYEEKKDLMFKKEAEAVPAPEKVEGPEGEKAMDTFVAEYQPFEVVKEQIRSTMLVKKRDELVNKSIGGADNEIYENFDEGGDIDFSRLAKTYGLSYVVATNQNNGTNYFTKDELNNLLVGVSDFPQSVFERELNDPSPPLVSLEGKFIFRVLEKQEPGTPPYEKIHDKVEEDCRYEKAFRKAEKLAEKCLEKVKQSSFEDGIKSVEGEAGKIQTIETDFFSRPGIFNETNYVNVLGADRPGLASLAFDLKVDESSIAVEDKGGKECYVVMLVERKKSDPQKFEEQKDSITQGYLMEKQLSFWTEWESWLNNKSQLGNSSG